MTATAGYAPAAPEAPVASHEPANRDVVLAELAVLRALIRDESPQRPIAALADARQRLPGPSTLDRIADGFGLTGFERAVLLLAAGPELVAAVAEELATLGRGPQLTFGTALSVLPDPHWSAVTPVRPLRRWELVRLLDADSPAHSPLVVDERVLHHLAGAGHLDARLAAVASTLPVPGHLPGSLNDDAAEVAAAWQRRRVAVVSGPQPANIRAVVAAAADRLGLSPLVVPAAELGTGAAGRESTVRRLEREFVLSGHAWMVECDDERPDEVRDALRTLSRVDAPVALACRSADVELSAGMTGVRVRRLTVAARRELLSEALRAAGASVPAGLVDEAAGVFDLSLADVPQVALDVADGGTLWSACRSRTRTGIGSLAQVMSPRAGWDDLVLPDTRRAQLHALVAEVRHRGRVLDEWGFAGRTTRGLGCTALFTGPSGTGKTLAAEVVAGELGLDLVVVDLSQVVSKYLGETEKHLRRVFDAAEDGGCLLLFDEADTLFGRRSEVRDSHDRYANVEVGYLLQRMESFRGLAILTTNLPDVLDPAFTRRLRLVVTFPYPDPALRQAMWARAFPAATPLDGVRAQPLAGLDVPGGGIASIALTAAYLAAADDGPVTPGHIDTAATWELAKTGRANLRRRPTA